MAQNIRTKNNSNEKKSKEIEDAFVHQNVILENLELRFILNRSNSQFAAQELSLKHDSVLAVSLLCHNTIAMRTHPEIVLIRTKQ